MKSALTLTSLLGGLGIVAALSGPPTEPLRGPYQAPLLPRLEFLKVIGAGQRSLVADYFWLQAVQTMGEAGHTEMSKRYQRYLDLFYYSDLVTDLDPEFRKVYIFAGNAVPTNMGRETWVNTKEARKLLEKGVSRFPNDADLRLFLAYNLSVLHGEHALASEHLAYAARLPDAPPVIGEMASRLLAHTEHFDTALQLAESFRDSAQEPEMQELFETRVKEIQRERILKQLDVALKAFETREGRRAASIGELVERGVLPGPPVDPMGGVIFVGDTGRAESTSSALRLEPVDFRKNLPSATDSNP
ncbi:pilus assembly protein [Myxococcaceae bacterium GXIMD 01537]